MADLSSRLNAAAASCKAYAEAARFEDTKTEWLARAALLREAATANALAITLLDGEQDTVRSALYGIENNYKTDPLFVADWIRVAHSRMDSLAAVLVGGGTSQTDLQATTGDGSEIRPSAGDS